MNPWESATSGLRTPLAAVDLDAFDANADDLVRRAGGLPVRVASKSLRCRALLDRVLARPGFAGVMAYAVPEALWLAAAGVADVFVAYPSADVEALRDVAADERLRADITLTVDSVEHVRWLRDALGSASAGSGWPSTSTPPSGSGACTSGSAARRRARPWRRSPWRARHPRWASTSAA